MKMIVNNGKRITVAILSVAVTLFAPGCGRIGLPGPAKMSYKYVKGESHRTEAKTVLSLDFSKLVLPVAQPAPPPKGSGLSLVPDELMKKVREGKLSSVSLECRMVNDQMVANVYKKENYADIYTKNELKDFRLLVNGLPVPSGHIIALIGGLAGEGEIIKRNENGGLRNLPKIMGLTIPSSNDPYLGRLLEYIRNAPAYPEEPMTVGREWSNNLSISVPVDSMSDGHSKGYIRVEVKNTFTLERVHKGIAYVKSDISVSIGWDVTVPEQGRTKLNLELTGDGYRMFDLKRKWEHGMFVKGDIKLALDAMAREKMGKSSTTQAQANGTFEFASRAI